MEPTADSSAESAAEDSASVQATAEFARALGLHDPEFAARLHSAAGGSLSLGRTAVEAAASVDFAVDLTSRSFADYVAALAPDHALELSAADVWVATVLAHLGAFTQQTALLALTSVGSAPNAELWDAEGILMRLRMAGVIVPAEEVDGGRYLRVPALLAALLRRDVPAEDEAGLVARLVAVLNDHLESAETVEGPILSDILTLSRRAGLWHELARVSESVGLPMFLLTPSAACTAFAGLPAEALRAEPDLGLHSLLTEDVLARLGGTIGARGDGAIGDDQLRQAIVLETRKGRMYELFLASDRHEDRKDTTDSADASGSADGADAPGGVDRTAEDGVTPLAAVREMTALAAAGRHADAVEFGLGVRVRPGARRTQLIIRLLTAISAFHDGRYSTSLSLLHDIEMQAIPRHVDGDFLLPATLAWSALAAVSGSDHDRADRLLARLAAQPPTPVDDMVHPAWSAATAMRALDRLDLDRARRSIDDLARASQDWGLRRCIPVLSRVLAVLSARTESDLLFANDDAETGREDAVATAADEDLVHASRSLVFVALGQLRWAEVELERMSMDSAPRVVQSVRVELVAGRPETAIALADSWFYHRMLTPAGRAELAAIRAAALSRLGRGPEATAQLRTAVGLAAWVSSLLPLALLPQPDRARLLELTADDPAWDAALTTFSAEYPDRQALFSRLREVGAVTVSETSMPQLTDPESRLLDLLASGLSIAEISTELRQVPGTVKNRLSALYRKFGVSSRAEVVARASSLGFITPN